MIRLLVIFLLSLAGCMVALDQGDVWLLLGSFLSAVLASTLLATATTSKD